MSSFIKYLSVILVILTILLFLMEGIYTASFQKGFSRNKIQYVIQLSDKHIDYIFLGSSRVENHIDCELVTRLTGKSCINLGLQGSKTIDSAALLQILVDNGVTYEKVLFQLDYAVNFDSYSPAFKSYIAPFIKNKNIDENLIGQLDLPNSFKMPFIRYANNDKIVGVREVLLQLYGKPGRIDFSNGFEGLEGTGKNIKGRLPQRIKPNNKGVIWMKKLEPHKMVFYTSPYCSAATNRKEMILSLQSNYPSVISYIDIFDDKEIYFVDCGHLNKHGASSFTEILTKDLLID